MYANILLSTDGSDVAKKGVKHGLALAKALNAKVTVISVTEPPSPIMWIPTQEDVDRFDRPADNVEAAVRYWLRAAEFALSRSANTEGARYAEMGLMLVERLAEGAERRQLELALQVARGNAALGIKGYTTSVRWNFRSVRPHEHPPRS